MGIGPILLGIGPEVQTRRNWLQRICELEKELERHLCYWPSPPSLRPAQWYISPSNSFVPTLSSISCLLFPIPSSYRFSHGSSLTLIDNTRHEQSVKTAKEISIRCILLILLPSLLLSRFPMPDAVNLIYPILPGIRRWRSDCSSCHIYLPHLISVTNLPGPQ